MSATILDNYSKEWIQNNVQKENQNSRFEKTLDIIQVMRRVRTVEAKRILNEHIEKKKDVCNNQPVIKGTRITVEQAIDIIYENCTKKGDKINFEAITQNYPSIQKEEQLIAAVLYYLKQNTKKVSYIWEYIFS